jgi:hypothetical protein
MKMQHARNYRIYKGSSKGTFRPVAAYIKRKSQRTGYQNLMPINPSYLGG